MMKRWLHGFILLLLCVNVQAQEYKRPVYPQGYFRWPLSLAPEIVANMGELRPNHWHMGLDMRTNQVVNQSVYAAADGYVAFMGIRPLSFGRFIIINHPNGLSTLYAHLNDFNSVLEAYATQEQYMQESWAVELTIPANKFPVKKGDFIAYSGTTGGSQGPHVHFEIFETKTGKRLNPLLFGMPLTDAVAPTLQRLAMYDRNKSVYEQSPELFAVKLTDSGYIIPKNNLVKTGSNKVSFGIQAFDRISGSNNQDGIYAARLFVDNQLQVAFYIDSIDYNATRYMNAHIDYRYKHNGGAYLQHVAVMPGDISGVYHKANGTGEIVLTDTMPRSIRIELEDAYKNKVMLNFNLQYDEKLASQKIYGSAIPDLFTPKYVNVLEKPDFEVYFPDYCLYDTVRPNYIRTPSAAANAVTALHQLHNASVPVEGQFTVRIKPDKTVPQYLRDKVVMRRTGGGGNVRKASWQGDWITAQMPDFGAFQAFTDITPPTVNELGKGDTVNLSAARNIIFTPGDNFGVQSFRAELNGKWLRFTNDKGRSWIYSFPADFVYGTYHLKVLVTDLVGNTTTKEWWFKRNEYTPPVKKKTVKKAPAKKKPATSKKATPVKKKKK